MRTLITRAIAAAALLLSASPHAVAAPPAPETAPARDPAAFERILAHPERVEPFSYAQLVGWLWEQGRREQAAFWFYMFQARTRPWAKADRDGEGDGAAAARAALNDQLGSVINGWTGSDPVAWKRIAMRAIAFEAHLPLCDAKPDGMTEKSWLALVAAERTDYDNAARAAFDGMNASDMAAGRRKNGLRNGPLDAPGPPLPDTWR